MGRDSIVTRCVIRRRPEGLERPSPGRNGRNRAPTAHDKKLLRLGDPVWLTRRGHPTNLTDVMSMAVRNLSLSMALIGATLATRALCAGGVISHPCDSDCAPITGQHNPADDGQGCDHEEGCASDPCSRMLFRSEQRYDSTDLAPAPQSSPLPLTCNSPPKNLRAPADLFDASRPPGGPRLPFPSSDVPLLL